ncbi:hypothetical protein [Aestuariicoccus sp. MJ-SS9]|uniref:hypothetical protein n=1 Tax=Aestuariicoccus sp. MJ-SS9 TaxID=3079855 RepID=UPI0029134F69|nr:hypothetical protein [Aestuariicoccus sp. MJ-SS9]MDU8910131.1 hypothetical protein [Aestuariicoccus sp. MJ-SS9]
MLAASRSHPGSDMFRQDGFLIHSAAPPEAGLAFDGYAFAGADFIVGEAGLRDWQAAGHGPLPWHCDGVYILMRQAEGQIGVSSDAAGYRHLFYYAEDGHWAVGESFIALVEHLRAQGLPLTEDKAHSAAFLSRKQLFQQLTTRHTPVREIRLLGRDERIEIADSRLQVRREARKAGADYPAALADFLNTWLSRFMTLQARPERRLFFHLSGGVDSRAVSAFYVYLRDRFGLSDRVTLRSLDDPAHTEDHRVVTQLAEALNLGVNDLPMRPVIPLSAEASLALWKRHSAGAYSPVRLPRRRFDPRDLHITGHGGGGYKRPLTARETKAFLDRMRQAYGYFGHGDRARWMADFEAELADLGQQVSDSGDIYNLFGRVSRSRFHSGQAATYKTQISPFDSLLAEAAADARPPEARLRLQFHYDVLASLAPALLELPFDDPRKSPGADNLAALTRVEGLAPRPGAVYGAFTVPEAEEVDETDPLRVLAEEVRANLGDLPKARVTWLFRWRLNRILRGIARGRRADPVTLRHLHAAWLLIRLRQAGVTPDA